MMQLIGDLILCTLILAGPVVFLVANIRYKPEESINE